MGNLNDRRGREAFEIWFYRRMFKIKWVEEIRNDRIGEKRTLCKNKIRIFH